MKPKALTLDALQNFMFVWPDVSALYHGEENVRFVDIARARLGDAVN